MKHFILCTSVSILLLASCSTSKTTVKVPAQQSIAISDNGYLSYQATLKNKSLSNIDVAVLNKDTDEQMSGFGLGKKAKVDVVVIQEGKLVLSNPNNKDVSIGVSYKELSIDQISDPKNESGYVSFTLQNNTAKSIPLLIPSVMNPNLSPFSKSGVDLKYGQKILFRQNGKRHVLLIVDQSIKDGDLIKVGQLLKSRKKELGL